MKITLLIVLLISFQGFGQTESELTPPEIEANFPGGTDSLRKFIAENVVYPEKAIRKNQVGKVYMSFVVEPDGSITHVKVEKGVSRALNREAVSVIEKMPNWTPGKVGEKTVRTRCRLPIVFNLE